VTIVDARLFVWGGATTDGSCSGAVYVFDTETFTWACPETFGEHPTPARGHSAVLAGDGKRLLVYGGGDSSFYSKDLYCLDTGAYNAVAAELCLLTRTQRR